MVTVIGRYAGVDRLVLFVSDNKLLAKQAVSCCVITIEIGVLCQFNITFSYSTSKFRMFRYSFTCEMSEIMFPKKKLLFF